MLAAKERALTQRLIAPPPFPALPTGALALKVANLRALRHFSNARLLAYIEKDRSKVGFYRLRLGPRKLGQRRGWRSGRQSRRTVRWRRKSRSNRACEGSLRAC